MDDRTSIEIVNGADFVARLPTPREMEMAERAYRRGYWHGYSQAMDDAPAKQRGSAWWQRMARFFDGALTNWRFDSISRRIEPPIFK